MSEKHRDFSVIFTQVESAKEANWVLLTEEELELMNEVREIREIVLDIETPDYQIVSKT